MEAAYTNNEIKAVTYVASVCFNPKRKKEQDERRKGKRRNSKEDATRKHLQGDLPKGSTVSYYV